MTREERRATMPDRETAPERRTMPLPPPAPDSTDSAHPLHARVTTAAVEDVTATLLQAGVDVNALQTLPDGTIPPPTPRGEGSPAVDLPPLVGDDDARHLELGAAIGKGGMGVVSLATQLALGRKVAVKAPHEGAGGDNQSRALLREAYALGALEHPNVVPVYMLGENEGGHPLLVMKRIEGTEWSDFLDGLVEPPLVDGADALEWNLGVFTQVCNAVHFAHDKGMIHRDVKPENVMIGDFGEVYLVDWGMVVTVRDDDPLGLPRARDVDSACGTPAYMAPEMVAGDGPKIGPRTDVYLLGGCLHTILTGEPRHGGSTLANVLASAYVSAPKIYDDSVPQPLAEIANRATAADPDSRFSTAVELRIAVAEFLRHRHSADLVTEANARVVELEALLESARAERRGEPGASTEADDEERSKAIYEMFSEARFAFRQAHRQWSGNREAEDGLQRALESMTRWELDQGAYKAASVFLSQMPRRHPELEARMIAIRERRRGERQAAAELDRMRREVDPTLETGKRSLMLIGIGVFFGLVYVGLGQLARRGIYAAEHGAFLGLVLVYGAFLAGFMAGWWRTLRESQVNRRFLGVMWSAFVGGALFWPIAWAAKLEFDVAIALNLILYFVVAINMAAAIDRRIVWAGLPFGFGSVATVLLPDWRYELMAAAVCGCLCLFGWIWRAGSPGEGQADGRGDGS